MPEACMPNQETEAECGGFRARSDNGPGNSSTTGRHHLHIFALRKPKIQKFFTIWQFIHVFKLVGTGWIRL